MVIFCVVSDPYIFVGRETRTDITEYLIGRRCFISRYLGFIFISYFLDKIKIFSQIDAFGSIPNCLHILVIRFRNIAIDATGKNE